MSHFLYAVRFSLKKGKNLTLEQKKCAVCEEGIVKKTNTVKICLRMFRARKLLLDDLFWQIINVICKIANLPFYVS